MPNDRRLLRPGGFAKAIIVTDTASAAAVVPTEAIIRFAGVTKLFIVEDGKAKAFSDVVTRTEGKGWVENLRQEPAPNSHGRHNRPFAACRRVAGGCAERVVAGG